MYKAISTMVLTALLMGFTALAQEDASADSTSIQSAVDAAAPGDTVTIEPGQYTETVVISKSITLQGVSRDGESPVVAPSFGAPAFFIVNPPAGAQITIDGFTMNVSGSSALYGETAGITLTNNVMLGDGNSPALAIYGPSSVTFDGNTVSEFQRGVGVDGIGYVQVTNNTFENVVESVVLTGSPFATITGNTMINDDDASRFRISAAVTISDSPNSEISDNLICNHHLGIFVNRSDDSVIQSNVMQEDMDTDGDGVMVTGAARVRIELNKITSFDYSMDFVAAQDNVVTQNWMEEAEIGLINANTQDPQFHVDARGNWWGASDGPSFSGGGHGVSVSGNVTFDDWLTSPPAMKSNDRSCP